MWEIVAFGRMGKEIDMDLEPKYITERQANQAAEELSQSSCYTYAARKVETNKENNQDESKNRSRY